MREYASNCVKMYAEFIVLMQKIIKFHDCQKLPKALFTDGNSFIQLCNLKVVLYHHHLDSRLRTKVRKNIDVPLIQSFMKQKLF